MLYGLDDAPTRRDPKIRYTWPDFKDVGGNPDSIRWRAMWDQGYDDGLPSGIELRCSPVVRKTRCGAWIDPHAYRLPTAMLEDGTRMRWEKTEDTRLLKFAYDNSNAAWAKPTRDEALRSLGIRLCRWSTKVRRDVERLNAACDVAEALLSAPGIEFKPHYAMFWPKHPASAQRIEVKE